MWVVACIGEIFLLISFVNSWVCLSFITIAIALCYGNGTTSVLSDTYTTVLILHSRTVIMALLLCASVSRYLQHAFLLPCMCTQQCHCSHGMVDLGPSFVSSHEPSKALINQVRGPGIASVPSIAAFMVLGLSTGVATCFHPTSMAALVPCMCPALL